ncbi:hypothetical protein LCGC14_0140530 [marine sediment metagenome]|uniref:Uncharacterized protein n=1 Tax=marine sediment metagenome TaxID=412755 RepID=A0A0F9VG69_9ZZZZ
MLATITIPKNGPFPELTYTMFSDVMAMSYGRLAALTLSDGDGSVTIRLSTGEIVAIGRDSLTGELGTSIRPVDMDVIRRCGGFREWANDVVIGPII